MSNSTPPGWYPVPGTGAEGAATHERWWDGNAWSSDVRPAAGPADRPPAAARIADAPTQAWQNPSQQNPPRQDPAAAPQAGFGPPAAQSPYGYPPQDALGHGYPQGGYPGAQGQPGYPAGAMYQPGPPAPRRSGNALVIGIVVAVLLVGGIAAGVALNSGGGHTPLPGPTLAGPSDSGGPTEPTRSPSGSPSRRASPSAPARSTPPAAVTGTVPDEQHAITVPLLTGWQQDTPSSSATVFLTSGHYTCPGGGECVRGQFSVKADSAEGTSARSAAESAMPAYAAAIFDGLTSHTDAGSAATSVAGVAGYAVRWHVRTKDGLSGYVLLAAVPAEHGGYVVFNGGVDEDPQAPGQAALDQILKGIEQDGSAADSA